MSSERPDGAPVRVGIVDYLNSRPLAWGFLTGRAPIGYEASYHPPAEVARRLAEGELDVGLIPSIELQRIPDLRVLPEMCVAAKREVRSVLLVSDKPPGEIRRVALDLNSRTSAALVRIVLADRYGVRPETIEAAPRVEEMLEDADAALVIGDPALHIARGRYRIFDLAREWLELTGHPFAFAVWAVRAGVTLESAAVDVFRDNLALGLREIERISSEAAEELELDLVEVVEYLTQNLSFELGDDELASLEEYFQRAASHGLIERADPIRFVS